MIRVLINGYKGRMGSETVAAVDAADDMEVVGGVDIHADATSNVLLDDVVLAPAFCDLAEALEQTSPSVVVDFTHPNVVEDNIRTVMQHGIDCVVGTTGLSEERLGELAALAPRETTLFFAPNFTTGAVLMMQFAKAAAKFFPDAEVIEFHHNGKADAPSGTAVRTAHMIAEGRQKVSNAPGKETELPGMEGARGASVDGVMVHAVRSDGYVAHQEVIFGSSGQTLTIRHDSIDRSSYMPGVLLAIRSVGSRSGLIIGLEKFMEE